VAELLMFCIYKTQTYRVRTDKLIKKIRIVTFLLGFSQLILSESAAAPEYSATGFVRATVPMALERLLSGDGSHERILSFMNAFLPKYGQMEKITIFKSIECPEGSYETKYASRTTPLLYDCVGEKGEGYLVSIRSELYIDKKHPGKFTGLAEERTSSHSEFLNNFQSSSTWNRDAGLTDVVGNRKVVSLCFVDFPFSVSESCFVSSIHESRDVPSSIHIYLHELGDVHIFEKMPPETGQWLRLLKNSWNFLECPTAGFVAEGYNVLDAQNWPTRDLFLYYREFALSTDAEADFLDSYLGGRIKGLSDQGMPPEDIQKSLNLTLSQPIEEEVELLSAETYEDNISLSDQEKRKAYHQHRTQDMTQWPASYHKEVLEQRHPLELAKKAAKVFGYRRSLGLELEVDACP
jgi:hypothetical protein